jgi:hypothetical protein
MSATAAQFAIGSLPRPRAGSRGGAQLAVSQRFARRPPWLLRRSRVVALPFGATADAHGDRAAFAHLDIPMPGADQA